jgi:hypothetical protein
MYGTIASTQLPIYGAKVLGMRNGVLDLHGTSIGVSWTYLNNTAEVSSKQIVLKDSVKWPVGGQIVIASTGDRNSQNQSETNYITAISADGKSITLKNPLKYQHLSVKRIAGGKEIYIRAEVGLLSRNVVFNAIDCDASTGQDENECNSEKNSDDNSGSISDDNSDDDSDDYSGKSSICSTGSSNYYSSSGANQFGAILMVSNDQQNQINNEGVIIRISNVEFYNVGQLFTLGGYAINFETIGDSPSSYISESSIHKSFNRAINIGSTNYLTINRTVVYDILGCAFFLESGSEIGNTFEYNLAVYVHESTSLLNEDSTPCKQFKLLNNTQTLILFLF